MVEVAVVGAGVFGLACAWACLRRGLSVVVLEAEAPGTGASGGVVGALSPFSPRGWSAGKAFQLAALRDAEAGWAEIAAAGGVDPGYARPGRIMPLSSREARARAEVQAEAARDAWGAAAAWRIEDEFPDWLDPAAAPCGVAVETLSARLDPRRAVAALAAAVAAQGGELRAGWRALAVGGGVVETDRGAVAAGAVILAGGAAGFALAPKLRGLAVKGQAALLAADAPPRTPLVRHDEVYIVPQPGGRVAVGATSEAAWTDPRATDARLDDVISAARALCPALRGAPVIERWAGLRPRGLRPEPMLGPVPGRPGVFLAGGGFRIGFGIALAVGQALAAMVAGGDPGLPPGWTVEAHLRRQMR